MTDRDHFAAAALAGLLANGDYGMESTPGLAWGMANAMLRERGNHIADSGKMAETPEETQDCPTSTPQVPPMPRTPQSDRLTEWERHGSHRWGLGVASDLYDLECRVAALEKGSAATPTAEQSRFNAAVMHWISEATSVWAEASRSDGGRKIMRDACMSCWDAYCPTNHDAAPAARASLPTADRAVCRGRESGCGTGDTYSASACDGADVLSTHDSGGPINRAANWGQPPAHSGESERRDVPHPETKGRAAGGPAHNTQDPVAWGVEDDRGLQYALHPTPGHASHMVRTASVGLGQVVPLYRHRQPTLTDAEREAITVAAGDSSQWGRPHARVLLRLLERTK